MSETLLVFTNAPDEATAEGIARHLVESRLAACVNRLAPCQSVYRWAGAVEEAREFPLLIKTTATRYPEVESAIRTLHPYELPEVVAVGVEQGLPAFLSWIVQETQALD